MNKIVEKLARIRKSDEIIFYITGDKKPISLFGANIGSDVIDIFARHLRKIGKKNKISLFLYTTGGSLDAPWPIVSLLREYSNELEVIVASKALSAGTLVCLGADKIVMTPSSFLSPIDPAGSYLVGKERKQIQIEDVAGFLDFAKEKVGITEQTSLVEIIKQLTSEIPAPILGSVNRTHSLIRLLARKMLDTHKERLEEKHLKQIIENLTERLYSHKHLIGRLEAKNDIGFNDIVVYTTSEEDKLVTKILDQFKKTMSLEVKFEPEELLEANEESDTVELEIERAIIQSSAYKDAFLSRYTIMRNPPGSPKPVGVNVRLFGWKRIESEKVKSKKKPRKRKEK